MCSSDLSDELGEAHGEEHPVAVATQKGIEVFQRVLPVCFGTSESSERGRLSRRVELGGSSGPQPAGRLASVAKRVFLTLVVPARRVVHDGSCDR